MPFRDIVLFFFSFFSCCCPLLRKERVERITDVAQRVGGLAVGTVLGQIVEAVTESQNNIPRGLLPCLALGLHPLVVPGGGLLGLLEDHLGVLEHVTGLGLESLGAEGDAAVDLVVVDDHALDLLSGLEYLLEVVNSVVGDLRDVKEAGHTTDLDEGTVGLEGLDHAVDNVASGEVGHLLLDNGATVGNDELVVLLIDLEELGGGSWSR